MDTDLNRDVEMNPTDPNYSYQTQEKVSDVSISWYFVLFTWQQQFLG